MRKIIIAIVLVLFSMTACTSPDDSSRILIDSGYTSIQMTGYRAWACSDDDDFKTGFKATSASGNEVTGTVCKGFLKGSTIRLD